MFIILLWESLSTSSTVDREDMEVLLLGWRTTLNKIWVRRSKSRPTLLMVWPAPSRSAGSTATISKPSGTKEKLKQTVDIKRSWPSSNKMLLESMKLQKRNEYHPMKRASETSGSSLKPFIIDSTTIYSFTIILFWILPCPFLKMHIFFPLVLKYLTN